MAAVLIATESASAVSTPAAGYVEFFYDSDNNNRLSYKSSDGVVHVLGANPEGDDCPCDIEKEFWCNVASMVKKGVMTAAQFQNVVNTGFSVTSSIVTDNLGNTTTVMKASAILYPVISVTISPNPVTNLSISGTRTRTLTAAVLPSQDNQTVVWVSSDTSKVTVTQGGVIYGVATGSATIYAYSVADPTKTDFVSVTVVA